MQLVEELVTFSIPLSAIAKGLGEFGWDCEEPLATLTKTNLIDVLQRTLSGTLSIDELGLWADFLECRDDVGYEENCGDQVKDAIFRLANPDINEPLTIPLVESLIHRLQTGES